MKISPIYLSIYKYFQYKYIQQFMTDAATYLNKEPVQGWFRVPGHPSYLPV